MINVPIPCDKELIKTATIPILITEYALEPNVWLIPFIVHQQKYNLVVTEHLVEQVDHIANELYLDEQKHLVVIIIVVIIVVVVITN